RRGRRRDGHEPQGRQEPPVPGPQPAARKSYDIHGGVCLIADPLTGAGADSFNSFGETGSWDERLNELTPISTAGCGFSAPFVRRVWPPPNESNESASPGSGHPQPANRS